MVHRRDVDGEEIVLGNQGDLYRNAMTWWDHATGSVWSQPSGRAILGPLAGTELELLPSTLTTWAEWRAAHPGTLALDAEGGGAGFDLARMTIVVDLGGVPTAYRVPELRARGVVEDEVGGVPIAVVMPPDRPEQWAVLSRRLDDRIVGLELRDGVLVDPTTDATWDPVRGTPLAGTDEGLDLLPAFTSFERDFRNHFPEGTVRDLGPPGG